MDVIAAKYLPLLNSKFDEVFNTIAPQTLYSPAHYALTLGGKRMRPLLCLMAAELFNPNYAVALPQAVGLELFHTFTLVHDDIMDAAPLRRNQPTVFTKWSTNTAILSGDAMFAFAYQHIAQCNPVILPQVLEAFNKAAIGVCEGQQYDMDFAVSDTVTLPLYITMISQKTAVLVAAALQIGALVGGASAEQAEHLYDFGLNMGIAFQLQDDILDLYGDADKVGKQVGGDILENKKTVLYLKALELASPEAREELIDWYSGPTYNAPEKLAAVTAIFNGCGVLTEAQILKNEYQQKALAALNNLQGLNTNTLLALANKLLVRQH